MSSLRVYVSPSLFPSEVRPIPAYAGEPGPQLVGPGVVMVYPRVRGGTVLPSEAAYINKGLSPRTRGNPRQDVRGQGGIRPIPAYAGEPRSTPARARWAGAYPRVRGGTGSPVTLDAPDTGLSPRTRGNPRADLLEHLFHGPIPANAGEPRNHCGAR